MTTMKKTLCFISLALIAAFASADVNISHNNSPAGTGNWNFNMYTGTGSTAWGGYLNPVRSFGGDTNISPIERLGFAYRNGTGQWHRLGNGAWDFIISEDTGFGAGLSKQVTYRARVIGGAVQTFEIQIRATVVPISGPGAGFTTADVSIPLAAKAYVNYDWAIKNITATSQTTDFAVLGDLTCRNMTPVGLNLNDQDTLTTNVAVGAPKATAVFSRPGCPTYYLKVGGQNIQSFEANKDVTPPIRVKLMGTTDTTNMANAVQGSGTGNWAIGMNHALTIVAGATVSGRVTLGYNVNPVPISGTVNLGDLDPSLVAGKVCNYEIRTAGTTDSLQSGPVTLGAGGSYSITTTLPAGTYDVAIKASHWLRDVATNVVVGLEGGTGNVSLINGDVDGDNEVTILDYLKLSAYYGKVAADSDWSTPDGDGVAPKQADLDEDGEISILDYLTLSGNYGIAGDN